MNLIKRQNPVFTSLIDDLFHNQDWNHISKSLPATNIIEADDHFNIELAAPGKNKSDFIIELEEGVLTISSEIDSKSSEKNGSFTRKEFGYSSFKRSFTVPETVSAFAVNIVPGLLSAEPTVVKSDVPAVTISKFLPLTRLVPA